MMNNTVPERSRKHLTQFWKFDQEARRGVRLISTFKKFGGKSIQVLIGSRDIFLALLTGGLTSTTVLICNCRVSLRAFHSSDSCATEGRTVKLLYLLLLFVLPLLKFTFHALLLLFSVLDQWFPAVCVCGIASS